MIDNNFIPILPFPNFKWRWASYAPTEGINDPVVLLGVLSRIDKLSGHKDSKGNLLKYSSEQFAEQLKELAEDLKDSGVNVNISERCGERNIIRNSGQYWRALNLIPNVKGGIIATTPFGKKVAEGQISQSEFSATVLMTYTLPNPMIQSEEECNQWASKGIKIQPLRLLLEITRALSDNLKDESQSYLTNDELVKVIIPLSAYNYKLNISDYARYIKLYRNHLLDVSNWGNVCKRANDHRMAREFMLFLAYYGYFCIKEISGKEAFFYNFDIDDEIQEILKKNIYSDEQCLEFLRSSGISYETERKLIVSNIKKNGRGALQPRFRKELLELYPQCIISSIKMPEVLIAAHIKPVEYNGGYDASNGFMMRTDLHLLFDANHLKIKPTESSLAYVEVDEVTRQSYGFTIPQHIFLPDYVSRESLRWRYDNYKGIKMSM